jgi:hypothetical protein
MMCDVADKAASGGCPVSSCSLWSLGYTVKAIDAPSATTLESVWCCKSDCQHRSDPDVS